MVATLIGGLVLATSAAFAGPPVDDSPGLPTSVVEDFGDHTAHYCVTDYAPNADVSVHNEDNGKSASIHTNHRGAGCTDVPVEVECGAVVTQTIVAVGVGADGNPATSKAPAAAPDSTPGCGVSLAGDSQAVTTGLSSTAKGIVAGAGAGGLALIGLGVVLIRRRRRPAADA